MRDPDMKWYLGSLAVAILLAALALAVLGASHA